MYADNAMTDDEKADLAELAAEVLKVLADPTRLHMAWLLVEGEHAVNDLAASVGKTPAGVSQHLSKMRLARLVTTRREGTTVYYKIDDEHVRHLVTQLGHHAEHLVSATPRHHRPRAVPEIS